MLEITTINRNFVSKRLETAATQILQCADSINSKQFQIAAILAETVKAAEDDATVFSADGYKNISEFTEDVFGFQKAMTNNLVRIGKTYIVKVGKRYISNILIPTGNENECTYAEFSSSQIVKMLSFDEKMVRHIAYHAIITPSMSCRELERILKLAKTFTEKHNGRFGDIQSMDDLINVESENGAETETTAKESKPELSVTLWDKDGHEYIIPQKVLDKYKPIETTATES